MKYQKPTPSGCKDIGIRKFEFVAWSLSFNGKNTFFENEIMKMICVCDESSLPNLEIMQETPPYTQLIKISFKIKNIFRKSARSKWNILEYLGSAG